MDDLATWAGVLLGNVLTLCIVWALVQFHRYNYKAPWLAYAAILTPLALLASEVVSTGVLTHQSAALTPQ